MKIKYIILAVVFFALLSLISASSVGFVISSNGEGFEVNSFILKFIIKEGDSLNKVLKIENVNSNNFNIGTGLDFLSISESDFSLSVGESKEILLDFDVKNKEAGVYFGEIVVSSEKGSLNIPVIIEIETGEVLFDNVLNVLSKSGDVIPGDNFVVESEIFNLENIGLEGVEVEYFATNLKGKTIFSEKENIAVEKSVLSTKAVKIPEDIEEGKYIFVSLVKYKNSVGTNTYLFNVEKERFSFSMDNNVYIWVVFILLLVVILFILYNQGQKDKLIMELARQRNQELGREYVRVKREKEKLKKLPVSKRRIVYKIIKKRAKKRIGRIRKIYKTRVKIIKRLRKQKKESELQRKMKEWKEQGFNVREFSVKISKPENLGKKAGKLKKQGYKF
ncbi:MAG: hypothetical protein ABIA78_02795 [archaeon]